MVKFYTYLLSSTGEANNAFNDILNNPRWQGNMDTMSPIIGFIDIGFTSYLTYISFFIIMAAMARNVLAAGYCAFPKFFDQVHEAHMDVQDKSWYDRAINGFESLQKLNMSTIKKFLMRLVPNIKVLTDFEDGVYDYKAYFTKAIYQMVSVICLGAFIYNGFHRDVAGQITNFGSEMFRRVMLNTDPVTFIDRITNSTGRPDFAYSEDKTKSGKLISSISQKAYSMIMSKYKDLTARDTKQGIASELEESISNSISTIVAKDIPDLNKYKVSYDVKWSVGSTPFKEKVYWSEDKNKATFVLNSINMKKLGFDSAYETDIDWVLTPVVTVKKSFDLGQTIAVNSPSSNAILTLHYDKNSVTGVKQSKSTEIKLNSNIDPKFIVSTSKVVTDQGSTITLSGNKLIIKGKILTKAPASISIKTGLTYKDSKGALHHTIRVIKLVGGSGTDTISDGSVSVKVGESLQEERIKNQGK